MPLLLTRPLERLPYAAFLPWTEALAAVDTDLRNPDAERRAAALSALAGAVRYDRSQAATYLALVRARRNEQDPVRAAMLWGLAELPPSLWRSDQLADLGGVLREALDAADLSAASVEAAETLIVRLLPFHPEWSAGWLGHVLLQERGRTSFYDLGDRLTASDVHAHCTDLAARVARLGDARKGKQPRGIGAKPGPPLACFPGTGGNSGAPAARQSRQVGT